VEILVVAPFPPYPPRFGGATRVFHLVRTLAREHRVTLACLASPAERAALGPLRDICAEVHTEDYPPTARHKRWHQLRSLVARPFSYYLHYSPALAARVRRLLAERRFDVVQLEFGDAAPFYAPPPGVPFVLDEHNVEYRLLERSWRQARSPLRRLWNRSEARKIRRAELAACRRARAVLTTSEVDRATLAPDVPGVPIRVVPNGVDTGYFTPGDEPVDPASIVFTGAIDYHPNTDGVLHFCADILPAVHAGAPDAVLTVVGKDPPAAVRALAGPRVVVTGAVPDVRPWMRRAAVFVVPLRVGGGTRLKILEALASGRAVVSTSIGCEGIEVTPGEDILVADTPAAFAAAVLRCLRDPGLRARLGARGRALVERRYRWEAIGEDLGAFYRELLDPARPPCAA
jgi:sugar transferase (PEP-CTERM/EpsH1 system associated)